MPERHPGKIEPAAALGERLTHGVGGQPGGSCSIQEGPEIIKSGGSIGASSLGFPGSLKAPSPKGKAPESSDTARDERGV